MSGIIRGCLLFLLIVLCLPGPAAAGVPADPAAVSAEAKALLDRVTRLDREISRNLGRVSVAGRVPGRQGDAALQPMEGYRARLHQLQIQASRLEKAQQPKVRKAIREALKKAELLRRAVENEKLRSAEKLRAMRLKGIAPQKAAKPVRVQAPKEPALAPPNDSCNNAQPVAEGSYSGDTTGATNDGSESCVGDPSEDIWYQYTATVTAPIRIDTYGSDFDTVLSVHTPPCPGTFNNEITCNDDCIGVDSCVTIPAVAGTTYMIRVGGYSVGETGSVQLHIVPSGAISGTVTASDTAQPLPDVYLEIYDSAGDYSAYAYTDSMGQYTSEALGAGDYYVVAYGSGKYLDKLYDNFPCNNGDCDVLSGTPVHVAAGATTGGIDFALDPGGSITGEITDASNGNPITDVGVEIFDESGSYAAYGYTDSAGKYRADGLLTGTYFVRTNAYGDYADELYDNIPCTPYCDETTGTPVSVTQGQATPGINFALVRLGRISGHVTDEATGGGISDVEVDIMNNSGNWMGYGYTDSMGAYTATRLPTGTYYVLTTDYNSGYIGELYDNIPCPNRECDPFSGTPIAVTNAQTTTGIDFSLVHGGTIVGRVTGPGGAPIGGAQVIIYDVNGYSRSYDYTDGSGYYGANGLTSGTYYAYANHQGYIGQVYNGFPCPNLSCSPTAGQPIQVTAPQVVTAINFTLNPGGSISGKVTEGVTHQDVAYTEIDIYDSSGHWLSYGYSDEQGNYTVGGLLTGNYFATVSTYGEYVGELYENIPCPYGNCDVLSGTPIPVTLAQDTPNIDFELDLAGSISGMLTDSTTGNPVPYSGVYIYDSNGYYVSYGYTDSAGEYTATGMSAGNHFAVTENYEGYVDELYDNIPCPNWNCVFTSGTPIPVFVNQNTPGVDFALSHGGMIAGFVTDSASNFPLQGAWVRIYRSDGAYAGYAYTDSAGHYSAGGLATGSYYVRSGEDSHMAELYNNIPCPWDNCDVTTGNAVAVVLEETTGGIDFALDVGGSISGTVTDSTTHSPLSYADIIITDGGGHYAYGYADSFGHYTAAGLAAGTYFVAASHYGYTDQLYQGIPCPNLACDMTTGTPVTVTDQANTPGIDFALESGGSIHGTITRESNGSPLRYAYVQIYDSSGSYVGYGYSDYSGAYSVTALQAGTYHAVAYSGGYVSEAFNNIACPGGSCDLLNTTPIEVAENGQTTGIDFALAVGSRIRGVVRALQSGAPFDDAIVKILNPDGTLVMTRYADYQGRYDADGLPGGTYYVMATGVEGYEDQLYDSVPCPDETCALSSGTSVAVTSGTGANGINFALEAEVCMYCDDFDDGELNPDWTYAKPAWSESNGELVGSPSGKKAIAIADPAFPGCSNCTIDTMVSMSSGTGKVWIEGWHSGKSAVELLINEQKDKWILKERVAGSLVQKAKGMKSIDLDTQVHVRMAFDGMKVLVFVDDMVTPLITMTPSAPLSGTVCLAVKGDIASFGYLQIR